MAYIRNLFSVGRRRGDEDQLTEMLVWLAEAVPAVATALIQLALEDRSLEAGDVTLATQHGIVGGRLDAYLTTADVAVIVESKLGSSYGGDQIRKYLSWLSSDAVVQRERALMTLTAVDAPWPPEDVDFARTQRVHGSTRRWEELHELFQQIAADPDANPLSARLVGEFLEMIAQEGLIPIKPLAAEEMGVAWSGAWQVIARYRDYFHSCKAEIAEALEATPTSGSSSDRGDWFWQDFSWPNGSRLAVGLLNTDRYERLPPGSHTGAPIIWLAPQAEHSPVWNAAAAWLDQHQPEAWRPGNRWKGRPGCWQYLFEIVGDGSFEQQRGRLATAAAVGRNWLQRALENAERTNAPAARK